MYMCYHYVTMLFLPLTMVQRQFGELQIVAATLQRTDELRLSASVLPGGTEVPTGDAFAVDLRHVSFSYPEGSQVLDDISLHVASGKVLGLLGRTGSGKTTISRLLFRFYDPTSGEVYFDGVGLPTHVLRALRARWD